MGKNLLKAWYVCEECAHIYDRKNERTEHLRRCPNCSHKNPPFEEVKRNIFSKEK